jgi:Kef-type K+ transport system membrane component KefB
VLLVELAAILLAAKAAGHLASRWGQPPVVGQLVAGLILGAVVTLLPASEALQESNSQVDLLSNLGVLFLMFLAGLETDWQQMRETGRAATVAACLGVALPLGAGYLVGTAFRLPGVEALFLGVVLTATSVSITAQTLLELGSLQTTEGATILGAAVIDDVIGLVVFSLAVAATGASSGLPLPVVLVGVIAFFGLAPTAGGRAAHWLLVQAHHMQGSEGPLAVAIAIGFLFAALAAQVGIAAITGAYLAGLLINREDLYGELTEKIKVLGYGLFIPIFLVKTGMAVRFDAMASLAGMVAIVSVIAILTKILGCGLGSLACGLSLRQSLVVGVGMVSRGEVALITAGLGLQAHVLSETLFSATVIIVLVTTLVTPVLLRLVLVRVPAAAAELVANGA